MFKLLRVLIVMLIIAAYLAGCGEGDSNNSYTLTVEIEGEGRVTPAEGIHRYKQDTEITLKAFPAEGWLFKEWVGAVADTKNEETTLILDGNQTVKALFVAGADTSGGVIDFDKPARSSYVFEGEGFRAESEGWNCSGLVGQWQWRYKIDIFAYGTIAGSGTSIIPPRPENGPWLTPPYSYTASGTLDAEDATVEVTYFFEDLVNEIIILDNGIVLIDTRSGTCKAVVKVVLPEYSFVVSETYVDVMSEVPGVIVFERHPECN